METETQLMGGEPPKPPQNGAEPSLSHGDNDEDDSLFNRPARIQTPLPNYEIEIPAPPETPLGEVETTIWERIGGLAITAIPTLSYALVMLLLGSGTPTMIFARLGSIVIVALVSFYFGRQVNKENRLRKEREEEKQEQIQDNYRKRIAEVREKLEVAYGEQMGILFRLHPNKSDLFNRLPKLESDKVLKPDMRLWERRPTDEDFLALRLGLSIIPSSVNVVFPDSLDYSLPQEQNYILDSVITMGEAFQYLKGAPLLTNLRKTPILSVISPESPKRYGLLYALISQLVVHHAPEDVALYIIAPEDESRKSQDVRWEWARWLPHCNSKLDGREGNADFVARDPASAESLLNQLLQILSRRREYQESSEALNEPQRHIVVIVDTQNKSLYERALFSSLVNMYSQLNISVIFSEESIKTMHSSTLGLVRLDIDEMPLWYGEVGIDRPSIPDAGWDIEDTKANGKARLSRRQLHQSAYNSNVFRKENFQQGIFPNDPEWYQVKAWIDHIEADFYSVTDMRDTVSDRIKLVRLKSVDAGTDIPLRVDFLEMYRVGAVEDINLSENWQRYPIRNERNQKVLPYPSPIGIGTQSKKVNFDIRFGFDGPHGLLAGTTGAGKSELLQTMVASLAIQHHPHFLSFFLVDYKGGSTFKVFQRSDDNKVVTKLPHIVGSISDLDVSEARRALVALKVEVAYRKQTFAGIREEQISDIDDYQELYSHYLREKEGIPPPDGVRIPLEMVPIPHLLFIIDEFAELKQELDEFMPEMNRIARVGRSLGIHLLLATQRPEGTVSEEVRSNSQSAFCLRVRSVADSRDMIRQPWAAFLPNEIPGRVYRQRGQDTPELFQSAWVGAPYRPQSRQQPDEDNAAQFLIAWGESNETSPKYFHRHRKQGYQTGTMRIAAKSEAPKEDYRRQTVVERIRDYIIEYSQNVGIKPLPELFLTALPDDILLDELLMDYERIQAGDNIEKIASYEEIRQGDEHYYRWKWSPDAYYPREEMRMLIGKLDDPKNRLQTLLNINLSDPNERGHLAIYGEASTGRTTLLTTLMSSLAQLHAPWECHLHIFDYGGDLAAFEELPHLGTYTSGIDEARVRRLLGWLKREYESRSIKILDKKISNLYQHNYTCLKNGNLEEIIPIIIIAIDNFDDLWETFPENSSEQELLTRIAEDGLRLGFVLLMTAGNVYRDIPGALMRSVKYRLCFDMNESEQTQLVVGGRPPYLDANAPIGRAMWRGQPPLQVQVARTEGANQNQMGESVKELGKAMQSALKDEPRYRINALKAFQLADLPEPLFIHDAKLSTWEKPEVVDATLAFPVGLSYDSLEPFVITLDENYGNLMILGRRASGKTSMLKTIVRTLAKTYKPEELEILLIADDALSANELKDLEQIPHLYCNKVLYQKADLAKALDYLKNLFAERAETIADADTRRVLVIMDNAHKLFGKEYEAYRKKLNAPVPTARPSVPSFGSTANPAGKANPVTTDEATEPAHFIAQMELDWPSKGPRIGLYFCLSYLHQAQASLRFTEKEEFLKNAETQGLRCITSHQNADKLGIDAIQLNRFRKRIRFDNKVGRGFFLQDGEEPQVIQFAYSGENPSD